jgi:hypothetical protein
MIEITKKQLVAIVAAALLVGWFYSSPQAAPSPAPQHDRPVLRWIARAAKNLLWIAIVAEGPPAEPKTQYVHARVGDDGFQALDHGRGW